MKIHDLIITTRLSYSNFIYLLHFFDDFSIDNLFTRRARADPFEALRSLQKIKLILKKFRIAPLLNALWQKNTGNHFQEKTDFCKLLYLKR